jgi:hypothetical protein
MRKAVYYQRDVMREKDPGPAAFEDSNDETTSDIEEGPSNPQHASGDVGRERARRIMQISSSRVQSGVLSSMV